MTGAVSPISAVEAVNATTRVGSVAQTSSAPAAQSARFNAAYETAVSQNALQNAGGGEISKLIDPLLNLNQHSSKLAEAADVGGASDMRPGELLNLTMRSHEFLFHCQLVSNVANRSSDGLQQLFRQQS